jgi:hypothetical protein
VTKGHVLCEVKSLDDDADNPNGVFEAILSAPTLDRDGEMIDGKAFEPLPDHISIDVDHGMTVATTVGSGVPFYDGDVLKIKGSYSSIPRAQELRTLVREGHIRKMSVTFMGAERDQKDGVPHVTKAELLNAAFVPIPSNREAAVLVAKAFVPSEDEKAGARNSTKDAENLQSIHDLAVHNGALCSGKAAHTTDTAAPETPAPVAGKSPASVVTQARTELARALLDL